MSKARQLQVYIRPILTAVPACHHFLDKADAVYQISKQLTDPEAKTINTFTNHLQQQQSLPPKAVLQILTAFINHPSVRNELKQKLTIGWLKFKFYECKDLLKQDEADMLKRDQISAFLDECDFPKSNLSKVLRTCVQIVEGSEPQESEIVSLRSRIEEGRRGELDQLFSVSSLAILQYNPDKSIPEQLEDLVKDYRYYPSESIEKELQKELAIAFADQHPEIKTKLQTLEPDLKPINSRINQLEMKFMREFSTLLSPEISTIFKNLKVKAREESYVLLSALKTHLLGINVLELKRLVEKTREAEQAIKEKDVILMVGNTGSGKSTTILKLLGYQLKQQQYKSLPTLVPAQQLPKAHQTFYTSPEAKSCTRFINAVPIPDAAYPKGTSPNKKNFVICDSPGLGDSAGVEVDIANGVGMINALVGSRSVRVVVLLPYSQITSNRGEGLVTISEAIGGIFTDYERSLDCVTVLFNKVPKQQMEQVHHLIENKIKNLGTHGQSNAVTVFLNKALQASEDEDNFLDPIDGDYKPILQTIMKKKHFLNDPQSQFRYDFTQKTKREIANYLLGKKNKIKDYFNSRKYDAARLQLRMIEQLKGILASNQATLAYRELAKHVAQGSSRQLAKFEDIVVHKLMAGQINERQAATMRDCKEKVIEIAKKFSDFDEIAVTPAQSLNNIIAAQEEKLQSDYQHIEDKNGEEILRRIKSFCCELSPQFESRFLEKLEQRFSEERGKMGKLIEQGNTSSMLEVGKQLKWLMKSLAFLKEGHPASRQMDETKKQLEELFKKNMQELQQELLGEGVVSEKVIAYSKRNIAAMKNIEALALTGSPKKWISLCLKSVESKCLRLIKQLESQIMKLIEQELHDYATPATLAALKPLTNAEKQVQLLMAFENTRQALAEECNAMKGALTEKLLANAQALTAYTSELRAVRSDRVSQQTAVIRYGFEVLIKCCELLGARDAQVRIAEAVESAVLEYLLRQRNAMNSIQFRLTSNFKDSLPKIQNLYNKMTTLARLNAIGEGPKVLTGELYEQFMDKLRAPFRDFKDNEITTIEEKDNYRYLLFVLEKLDKLGFYAMQMQRIMAPSSEYSDISADEAEIEHVLQKHMDAIRDESKEFVDAEIQPPPQPAHLRELTKVVVAITQKEHACRYISGRLCVDISEIRDSLKAKLESIKESIQQKLDDFLSAQNKISYLQDLIAAAKFYAGVEDPFKFKSGEAINFKDLEKRANQCYIDSLNNDEECAIAFIRDNRPSQICFPELAVIYRQFTLLPNPEGIRKRAIITSELKKVQRTLIDSLKKVKYSMASANSNLINDRSTLNQFADDFHEAIELEKELSTLYEEDDRRFIEIGQFMKDLAKTSLEFFREQSSEILQLLNAYDFSAAENRISKFGCFEEILYENSYFATPHPAGKNAHEDLSALLDEARRELWKEIRKYESFEPERSVAAFHEGKRIQELLEILRQKIKTTVQGKFSWYNSENFVLDQQFTKYYSTFRNASSQEMKDKKEGLEYNIKIYFNALLNDVKEKTGPEAETAIARMQASFNFLPYDLRAAYASSLEAIRNGNAATVAAIETKQRGKVKTISQLYTAFVDAYLEKNEDSFLQQALKNHFENEKVKMMEKVIETQAFEGFQGPFFDDLPATDFFIRRFKKELANNSELIDQFLHEYDEIGCKLQKIQKIKNNFKKVVKMASFSTMLKKTSLT